MNPPTETDELQQEKERILKRIEELKSKAQEEYQEEILNFLECDNPKVYRKKMKGFMLPFNTRTRYEDETNHYKAKKNKDIEEIKKQVRLIKSQREKQRNEQEAKKNNEYTKHQNVMRKMHEDLLRDKGLYVPPGSSVGINGSQLPNNLTNNSNANKRVQGYKIPRKFTLESLGKLDYTVFGLPSNNEYNDEFKPDDVLDSDDELDEEIMNLYHYKERSNSIDQTYRSVPNHVNSVIDISNPKIHIQTNIAAQGVGKIINSSTNKSMVGPLPVPKPQKSKADISKVNRSMLPEKRKSILRTEHKMASGMNKNLSPARGRGLSLNKYPSKLSKSPTKSQSKVYGSKSYIKSKQVNSDYSPGRKRKTKMEIGNLKSLKKANEYDLKSRKTQDQRLKNILKMQNEKSLMHIKKKIKL